jgi:hypothetical protein
MKKRGEEFDYLNKKTLLCELFENCRKKVKNYSKCREFVK